MGVLEHLTVLVVAGDRAAAERLAAWVRARGAFAVEAHSARAAWSILQAIAVDAIVGDDPAADPEMALLGGWLAADPELAEVPIVRAPGGELDAHDAIALEAALASGRDADD